MSMELDDEAFAASAEDDEATYWPGYVDALTNIVLNLLFRVGVFAVGVFALSIEAQLQKHQTLAEQAGRGHCPQGCAARARRVRGAGNTQACGSPLGRRTDGGAVIRKRTRIGRQRWWRPTGAGN